MIGLLMSHPGAHAVAHAAPMAVLPQLFRRLRRKPSAPAGTGLTVAQQAAHADRLHRSYKVLADEQRRPVNGRNLGTLPRLTTPDHPPWHTAAFPVYGETSVASVLAAEEQAKGDAAAAWYQTVKPGRTTLERVRDGLRNLPGDRPDATYRGGWQ